METTASIHFKEVDLTLERYYHSNTSIIGALYFGNLFLCDTLEPASSKIPEGIYTLRFSTTPTWSRFYNKAGYFYQIRLMDVPGREGILLHIGNTYKDSDGCILVGDRDEVLTTEIIRKSRVTYSALCDFFKSVGNLYGVDFLSESDYIEFDFIVKVK